MRSHSVWLRIDGVPLDNIVGWWGGLTFSFGEKGCKALSFAASFKPGQRHSALRAGALVERMDGPTPTWAGLLAEPDWPSGVFTADGLAASASRFPAWDVSHNSTSEPDTAVEQAANDGWQILGHSGLPTTAFTATASGLNMVDALLNPVSDELAKRWYVMGDRIVRMAADPEEPTWQIPPGLVDLGLADDDFVTGLVVVYQSGPSTYSKTPRVDEVAAARFGPRWAGVDASDLGTITLAKANAIGDGILAKGRARLGWTQAVEVSANQLLTMDGRPADLSLVRSLQMVRVHGVVDDVQYLPGRTYLDLVIGETSYADGAGTISLSPIGKVSQSLEEMYEELAMGAA